MEPKYQYFRSHSTLVRLRVTENPSTGLCYIFWGDLRVAFPGIARVQDGDVFVPFMRCQREFRLKPFRIEYIPNAVLDIIYKDEANPNISLTAALRASKRKAKEPLPLVEKEGDHDLGEGREQDFKGNTFDHRTVSSSENNVNSTSSVLASPPSVTEFDPSLLSPSSSPSPSPSPSPIPRTPDSLANELMEHDDGTSSANSSVDYNLDKTMGSIDEPIAPRSSHGSSSPNLRVPFGSGSESSNSTPQAPPESKYGSVLGSGTATPSGTSLSSNTGLTSLTNESKLSTVMSLVKGLSLQVAGSGAHKDVQEAAAKHSVKISNLGSIIAGTMRTTETGVMLEPSVCRVEEAGPIDEIERTVAKPSHLAEEQSTTSITSQGDDDPSKKDDLGTTSSGVVGPGGAEDPMDTQEAEPRHQHNQLQQKKQLKSTPKQKQQAQKQQAQKQQVQKQQQTLTLAQPTALSKSTIAKAGVANATSTASRTQPAAKVNPYSLLTNAMPLLLQSGLFSEYTGSLTGTNGDPRASALVDVITSYQESEELIAFNRMNSRGQRVPYRHAIGKSVNEKDGTASTPGNNSNIDPWTEIGQLLKVFTQAAAKGNLRVADKMGLQLERKLYNLEKKMVAQPELKARVQPVSDSFQESQHKLTPIRNARIQKNARALLEQRLSLTESIVPNMFVVLPVSLEANPIQLRVHFLCQCRGEALCQAPVVKGEDEKATPAYFPSHFGHLTSHPGYELVFDQQLVLVGGLYMYDLLEIIKYGVTLENVYVEQDDDEGEDEENQNDSTLHSDDRGKTKTIIVPPLNPRGSKAEVDIYHRVNYAMEHIIGNRCVETSPGGLRSFLKGLTQEIKLPSRDEPLGGLVRVLSSQGSTRWLCDDHYNALHRAPRMSAFVRLIEGQKAVPIFWEYHLGQVQVLFPSRKELKVFLNILKTLRAPIQDLTLMLDWPLTALDLQQLHQSLRAFAVNIPSIRICLGKGSTQEESEAFKQNQDNMIASMIAKPEVHLFLLEDARPLQEEWDASTRLFANHKELNFDNWERYPNTRAVVIKNACGFVKLGIVVESTEVGLELVKRYFGGESAKSRTLMGLQLYANKHDAVKYEFKDGVMTDVCLSATSSSPKKLLQISNIELLQFKVQTKQDRSELESILKRNSTICEVEVHCPMEIMPDIFTLLKRWRRGHGRPPSVRIEHGETKLWWIQELFNYEPPSLELSVQEPVGLGPILEMVAPELRTFEGPLSDSQAAIFMYSVRKKGSKLTELDLDISYFTPAGYEYISKVVEMSRLEMLGVIVSSRTPASMSPGAVSPTMDWPRIAHFILRVRNVSRSLQFIGQDVNEILQNLQPKLDLTQLSTLKKVEIYGGKSVSLDPIKGLPMVLSFLTKVSLWTVKFVDIRIDHDSWTQILGAINYQRLIWLDIRQSGFGPDQMACLLEKMPKNSTIKKLYIRMGVRPTSKQLQQWRAVLAKKTTNLNFLCEMDERAPNEIGMRVRDIRF